jgi:hypothetical protein
MASCLYTTVCISNTGNDSLNDTYVRTGTFNDNSYYIGQTNNYVIFFSSEGYWCVADYIDGPCLLTGKSPCTSVCPDFCDDYYQRGACPPPEPPPVNPCDIFDFEAIFDCDVDVTPTPTPTNTSTPTLTPTPTSTSLCPLFVDATILSFTPTPTVTPSFTPTSSGQITRDCGFLGDVTFNTINSIIDCPFSLEFQDCYNGAIYYTTNALTRPEGGSLERFMIYQANVDNVRRCISYVGVNVNIIGSNTINFISNLIGYSNLGQCVSCLGVLAPTPTPTPSITPTITLTSTSNKPEPPPASNTPTPTKTKPVLYYIYENCDDNLRICQQIPAVEGLLVNQAFKTGNVGEYRNQCWFLYSVSTFCPTQNPNYQTLVYNTNAFPSVLNATFKDCNDCAINVPLSNPPSPSNSPTPTRTVTPTRPPQVQACKPHQVKITSNICAICTSAPIYTPPQTITVYSPSDNLVIGSYVYVNSTCTSPIPASQYIQKIGQSTIYLVVNPGILLTASCASC